MRDHVVLAWMRLPPPLFLGGAEVSQATLAEYLVKHCYPVTMIGCYNPAYGGRLAKTLRVKLASLGVSFEYRRGVYSYQLRGIQCLAVPKSKYFEVVEERARNARCVITSHENSDRLCTKFRRKSAVVGWIHSSSAAGLTVLKGRPEIALVSSKYLQTVVREVAKDVKCALFYPPFRDQGSAAPFMRSSAGKSVTMVNPIPSKGSNLFWQLAHQLPCKAFHAQEGWYPVDVPQLPNTHYGEQCDDMTPVIEKSHVLLMPSVSPEGFGRVVVEFGIHGVPALVHKIGALPEVAASARLILPTLDIAEWRSAIEALDHDRWYAEASEASRRAARKFIQDPVPLLRDLRII